MKRRLKRQFNKQEKKHIKKLLCKSLIIAVIMLIIVVCYHLGNENIAKKRMEFAKAKEIEITKELELYEKELEESTKRYVEEIGAKASVILLFDDMENSAYRDVIQSMKKYGFAGIVVFRDGKVPGSEGGLSLELYEELVEAGWETAIGNSEEIQIYKNAPDSVVEEWEAYIESMRDAFRNAGMPIPEIYIPHKDEEVAELQEALEKYQFTAYSCQEEDIQKAIAKNRLDDISQIGTIVSRYDYETLSKDVQKIIPTAQMFGVHYLQVSGAAPRDKKYTSVKALQVQLEQLSRLDEFVNVMTFSGYRKYQNQLLQMNKERYKAYMQEQQEIEGHINDCKNKIKKIYENVSK